MLTSVNSIKVSELTPSALQELLNLGVHVEYYLGKKPEYYIQYENGYIRFCRVMTGLEQALDKLVDMIEHVVLRKDLDLRNSAYDLHYEDSKAAAEIKLTPAGDRKLCIDESLKVIHNFSIDKTINNRRTILQLVMMELQLCTEIDKPLADMQWTWAYREIMRCLVDFNLCINIDHVKHLKFFDNIFKEGCNLTMPELFKTINDYELHAALFANVDATLQRHMPETPKRDKSKFSFYLREY